MGLFSRKKPQQALPPVPRFPVQQDTGMPSYESEFPHPEEHREQRMPEFPEFHAEPVNIPPPPQVPSFPRPQVDDKSQNLFIRTMDDRLPTRQEPITRPAPVVMPHPEALQTQQAQPYPPNVPMRPRPTPIEIPVREPAFNRRPVQYPDRIAVATQQAAPWQRQEQPRPTMIPDRPLPPPMMPPQPVARPNVSLAQTPPVQPRTMSVEDKPLFIKIGQYREAMSHLELLKQKIKDAETALAKLEDLRAKEQAEITNAHALLATVKEKLLTIDKQLFEV